MENASQRVLVGRPGKIKGMIYTLTFDSQGPVDDYTITVSGSTMTIFYAGNAETGGTEMTSTWTRIN